MGKWISVEERLPEAGKDVLIHRVSGGIEVKRYVPPDGAHYWGWYPGGTPICNTTHWQPLPAPPGAERFNQITDWLADAKEGEQCPKPAGAEDGVV